MNNCVLFSPMVKLWGRLGYLALFKQTVPKKENTDFKYDLLCSKNDQESLPAHIGQNR